MILTPGAAWRRLYSASDAATAIQTVTVQDTTAPTITLNGDTSVSVLQGSAYTDAGATASDLVDGSLTSGIGLPNTGVPGVYTVTYDVSDAANNSAHAERTVTVNAAVSEVSVDNVTTFADDQNAFSFSHGVSGTNRLLVVTVACDSGDKNVGGVSYAGQNLQTPPVLIFAHPGGKPRVDVYSMANPPTNGSNVVAVTLANGNSEKFAIWAISYIGVDQTTPISGVTTSSGSNAAPSLTVDSGTGDVAQGVMASIADGVPTVIPPVSQSAVEMGGAGNSSHFAAASTQPGASPVAMNWTIREAKEWVAVGININVAGGAP